MDNNTLNIFFVLDKNYIVPFTVTLTSVLENNKDLNIQVFVLHEITQNDSLDTACKFFEDKYDQKVNLIYFEDKYFNDLYLSEHITKAGYFKLLLGQMIPEAITSGLYLDCDLVITGSLKGFCNRSFFDDTKQAETSLLAVTDVRAGREITRLGKMGEKVTSYFNTGVFYVNLKKWREENMAEKMIAIARKYNEQLVYLDQDIMNIFFKGDQAELEDAYNKDAAIKHAKLPIILHYLGNSKPWHYVDNSPNKHFYKKYLKMTPFKNLKPEGISLENFARKYVRLFRQKRSAGPDYNI